MAKDLTLVLKVDAAQFKQQMSQATTQVDDFGKKAVKASADSQGGFASLRGGLEKLQGGLTNLLALMAGGGLAAFAGHLIAGAQASLELAQATGMSIAEVKGLEGALDDAGGKAESAGKLFTTLSKNFEDAFAGGKQAQKAFIDLGMSLGDLNRLQGNTQALMQETATRLVAMGKGSEQTALATQIFGKAIQGVDLEKFLNGLKTGAAENEKYADSIQKAGDFVKKLQAQMREFGDEVLKALAPVIEHFSSMEISTEDLMKTFKVLGVAALALGLLLAPIPVIIAGIAAAVIWFADKLAPLAAIVYDKLTPYFEAWWATLKGVGSWITNTFYDVIDGLQARFAGIAAAWEALKNFENPLTAYNKAVEETLAVSEAFRKSQQEGTQATEAYRVEIVGYTNAKKEATAVTKQAIDAWAKEKQAIEATYEAYKKAINAAAEKLGVDTKSIGVTDQLKRQTQAYADIESKAADLRAKYTADLLTADDQVKGTIRAKIALIDEEAAKAKKSFDEANTQYTGRLLQEKLLIDGIKQKIELQQQTYDWNKKVGDMGVDSAKRIKDAEFELQMNALSPKEAQLARLTKSIEEQRVAALKSITDQLTAETEALQIRLDNDVKLTEQEKASIEEKILANTALMEKKTVETNTFFDTEKTRREESMKQDQDYQSSFEGGWKKAYDNFVNNTASASAAAGSIFNVMSKGFEDAFVSFVTTGKISFKSLIDTMIKELIRLAAQQAFKIFLNFATGGGSGILGTLAGFLGFADGGYVPTNGPVLVGERGPEIVQGIGGRNVIPNDQLGGLGGGGGTVNYYITAVDSLSFKQMIARDPEFLYAVTQKGRQRSPLGR